MPATQPQSSPTDAPDLNDARALLSRVWGHADFRGMQGQVVEQILSGGDVLAVLPTGGGKSVCYQIPAMIRPGLGLVISPLIALMSDQVLMLEKDNVVAADALGLSDLGIDHPAGMAAIAPSYLWRYRVGGQFAEAPAH